MGVVSDSVKGSSRAGTALGFAVMIFGILAIMAPFIAGIGTTMLLAILLTGAGVATTICFQSRIHLEGDFSVPVRWNHRGGR